MAEALTLHRPLHPTPCSPPQALTAGTYESINIRKEDEQNLCSQERRIHWAERELRFARTRGHEIKEKEGKLVVTSPLFWVRRQRVMMHRAFISWAPKTGPLPSGGGHLQSSSRCAFDSLLGESEVKRHPYLTDLVPFTPCSFLSLNFYWDRILLSCDIFVLQPWGLTWATNPVCDVSIATLMTVSYC